MRRPRWKRRLVRMAGTRDHASGGVKSCGASALVLVLDTSSSRRGMRRVPAVRGPGQFLHEADQRVRQHLVAGPLGVDDDGEADAGAGEAEGDAAPEAEHRPPRGPRDVRRAVAFAAVGPGDEAAGDPRKFLPARQQYAASRGDGVEVVGEGEFKQAAVQPVEVGAGEGARFELIDPRPGLRSKVEAFRLSVVVQHVARDEQIELVEGSGGTGPAGPVGPRGD